jgi:hypothetical protein
LVAGDETRSRRSLPEAIAAPRVMLACGWSQDVAARNDAMVIAGAAGGGPQAAVSLAM